MTERIWPCVQLQWEWLGGTPAIRRAVVVGAGEQGTGLAVALSRAGLDVQLGCRTGEQVDAIAQHGGINGRYLPGHALPAGLEVVAADDLDVAAADLVVLAVPAHGLPVALADHGARVRPGAGVLVLSRGLVAPSGALPAEHVAAALPHARVACVAGPADAAEHLEHGAALLVAGTEAGLPRELCDLLRLAGLDARASRDLAGASLASVAGTVAALAATAAVAEGHNAAGAAAGRVFEEVVALATARGAQAGTFTGPAGAGDLVAAVLAGPGRSRSAEERTTLALLPGLLRAADVRAPGVEGLAAVVAGEADAEAWARSVTRPSRPSVVKAA